MTNQLPETLPILPLRGMVVYPLTSAPLNVGQPRSVQLVETVAHGSRLLGLFASHNPEQPLPGPDEMYRTGTLAAIHRQLRAPDGTMRLLVQGVRRIRLRQLTAMQPYMTAEVEAAPEEVNDWSEFEPLLHHVVEMFKRLSDQVPAIPGELIASSLKLHEPLQVIYTIATYLRPELHHAQRLLEMDTAQEKLEWLARKLKQELEVLELGRRIQLEAYDEMERGQRDHYLREQLKAIQRELGEEDERVLEAAEFEQRIAAAELPIEARREAERELKRLLKIPVASAEYSVVRTYLEWLTGLPWDKATPDNLDLAHARRVLDEDHHALGEIKERIVEYLAVRKLRQERALPTSNVSNVSKTAEVSTILCFAGPPGVGKTSLGRSIARATGRHFIRIALGGIRDEAEIRGHRRTYVGAMPGRVIQALRRVECRNPVIMLDEVDKIGSDFQGDPAAALLELLDPQQNRDFRDHYLDVPFDLSAVMFITTANTLDPIPPALRDRLEVVQLSGYTEAEKVCIAQAYLLPRLLAENGLRPDELIIEPAALQAIVRDYTREAGVRELERLLGRICRKVAAQIATADGQPLAAIGRGRAGGSESGLNEDSTSPPALPLLEYLGRPRYFSEAAARTAIPGVATGLSWTSSGGSIIFVEAARMPGGKSLTITGQVGDVMRESAQAALAYIRSQAERLGIEPRFFEQVDLHVHIPAGAIPKDGPSAGLTIAVALASLLTGRPVRSDAGMTGEITLRGQVLPVGGLKEKVLAAHRAGLTTVILPHHNAADLDRLPADTRQSLNFVFVEHIDEAITTALLST